METNELRALVAANIQNPDDYYQNALKSEGINWDKLTHTQIAIWKAQLRVIEADLIIDCVNNGESPTTIEEVDMSFLENAKSRTNGEKE